jgi:lipoate-protein ligase A
MRWHFLMTPPADGAWNMALDEALMRRAAGSGDAVFRVYGWSSPTLSLGRNQRARDCYDLAEAAGRGVAFVRRPTGGRALLHHREITYSVTMPIGDAAGARVAYDRINAVLLDALTALGVPARHAAPAPALAPGLRPCFDVPAAHEIAIDGRKLVGSAQWRHEGALLQHGSILVHDDQELIQRLLKEPVSVTPPAATLAAALGREPEPGEVAAALSAALSRGLGAPAVLPIELTAVLRGEVDRLCDTYHDDAWTWRR